MCTSSYQKKEQDSNGNELCMSQKKNTTRTLRKLRSSNLNIYYISSFGGKSLPIAFKPHSLL